MLVVFLFLRQVFLNLPHVGADIGGRGEDGGDVERDEIGVGLMLSAVLHCIEQRVVLDGVVDARRWRGGR